MTAAETDASVGKQVAEGWCGEKAWFNIRDNSCRPGKACGHYTQVPNSPPPLRFLSGGEEQEREAEEIQMVWETTTKVGCGFANCPAKPGYYVVACNYHAASIFTPPLH